MLRRVLLSCALAVGLLAPAVAGADGFFAPFYGAALTGTFNEVDDTRKPATWGAAVGSMGGGIFGFEAEIAFSPDFYAKSDEVLFGDNSVTTMMGNALFGAPIGGQKGPGFRPYATAGFGLIRQRIEGFSNLAEFSSNNFGYNLGGGAFIFLGKNFGFRGDFRYFHSLTSDEDSIIPALREGKFNYSRATVGLVFRYLTLGQPSAFSLQGRSGDKDCLELQPTACSHQERRG